MSAIIMSLPKLVHTDSHKQVPPLDVTIFLLSLCPFCPFILRQQLVNTECTQVHAITGNGRPLGHYELSYIVAGAKTTATKALT